MKTLLTLYGPPRLHRALALVPAGEGEVLVAAERAQQVVQVRHADVDVAVGVVGDRVADEDVLDVVPRRRQELHHALRADVRDDVVVVARLHPGERAREAAVDAVVRRPAVERVAHRSRVRRRHRRGRRDALRRGDAQLDADQERLRRIELVELRDLAERRPVLARDRRQRVARPHDVARQQRRGLHLLHRHARLQPERRERRRPGNAVGMQVHRALVPLHARQPSACPCTRSPARARRASRAGTAAPRHPSRTCRARACASRRAECRAARARGACCRSATPVT